MKQEKKADYRLRLKTKEQNQQQVWKQLTAVQTVWARSAIETTRALWLSEQQDQEHVSHPQEPTC